MYPIPTTLTAARDRGNSQPMTKRHDPQTLIETTTSLFTASGLDESIVRFVVEFLVETGFLYYLG